MKSQKNLATWMPKAVMNSVLFSIIFEIVIIFWKLGEGGGTFVKVS